MKNRDPTYIMQTATAFWASKVLITASDLELFNVLASGPTTGLKLKQALGLQPARDAYDFLNAFGSLMSLNMLIEIGDAFDYTVARSSDRKVENALVGRFKNRAYSFTFRRFETVKRFRHEVATNTHERETAFGCLDVA